MSARKIIHIDMDAFYASIEQRDNPEYRGKPLAVGYSGSRGVVAAASYEARKYGVRSAMPSKTALRKCPHLIFTPARFEVYKVVSKQIMEIFLEYTDLVEPLSLDEAYLDVTVNHKQIASATQIAREIKQKIREKTSLTASAGVSFNKFLAKIASDYNKPDGLFVIEPKIAEAFVEKLPIQSFFGVGKVTAEKMWKLGVFTGWDLKQRSERELVDIFGKVGYSYFQNARAIDFRPVDNNRICKSVGAETTFLEDIDSFPELEKILFEVAEDVILRINKRSFRGHTVTLKMKYADFKIITRSKTLSQPVIDVEALVETGKELLQYVDITPKVRLLGLTVKTNDKTVSWREEMQLEINFDFDNP